MKKNDHRRLLNARKFRGLAALVTSHQRPVSLCRRPSPCHTVTQSAGSPTGAAARTSMTPNYYDSEMRQRAHRNIFAIGEKYTLRNGEEKLSVEKTSWRRVAKLVEVNLRVPLLRRFGSAVLFTTFSTLMIRPAPRGDHHSKVSTADPKRSQQWHPRGKAVGFHRGSRSAQRKTERGGKKSRVPCLKPDT